MTPPLDMNDIVGSHDLLLVTLDTLRHDVAEELAAAGRIPNLARHLPGGGWERRHAPGNFTYASHQAMFAGFLPTPATPGPHPRLFAARFAGSETTADGTFVYDTPTWSRGWPASATAPCASAGWGSSTSKGRWAPSCPECSMRVTGSRSSGWPHPLLRGPGDLRREGRRRTPPEQRLFLFVNVAALHQPNWFHLPGATREDGDTRATHAAALEYVDRHIGRLFDAASSRRPCFAIVCSDHGTAYGEDGYTGHRVGHDVVWTVPYAHFFLDEAA